MISGTTPASAGTTGEAFSTTTPGGITPAGAGPTPGAGEFALVALLDVDQAGFLQDGRGALQGRARAKPIEDGVGQRAERQRAAAFHPGEHQQRQPDGRGIAGESLDEGRRPRAGSQMQARQKSTAVPRATTFPQGRMPPPLIAPTTSSAGAPPRRVQGPKTSAVP
jgi:hypothetical protein